MSRRSRKKISCLTGSASSPLSARLESWIGSNRRPVTIVSLILNLLLCLALFEPKLHTGGDNASYIILAESILTAGDGYSQHISPGPPEPLTLYPFGYPLMLAPLVALFGPNVLVLKGFSILCSLGVILMFSLLARRLIPPLPWAALTMAVAVNPVVVEYSHWILSEIAFQFFSILTLYLMVRAEEDRHRQFGPYFWAGILIIAFTVHIRTIGISFAIAGFAYLAFRRSWRRLAFFTLAMALLLAPWMIRNKMVSKQERSYGQWLLLKNPYSPEEGSIKFYELSGRALKNLKIYSLGEMSRVVLGPVVLSVGGTVTAAVAGIFSLLVVLGLVRNLLRGFRFLEMYVIVYLGVVLIWPDAWSDVRFIMAIVPFFMLYMADGVAFAAGWRSVKLFHAGVAQAVALSLVALLGLGVQLWLVPGNLNMIGRYLRGDRYAGYHPAWRNLFQAGDWICENTPEEKVITVRKPRLFYIHTGRKVDGYPFTTNTDSVLKRITSSDYVVVDAVSGTTYRYLIPAIQKVPERFKLVYRLDKPFTGVLEVVK